MKLCACLTEETVEDCIRIIKKLDTDFIEHRIDFMKNKNKLENIYNSTNIPIIATIRSVNCGGNFKGSEEGRTAILKEAIDAGCKLIDIELETNFDLKKKIIEYAQSHNVKLIISMHDFEKTPDVNTLVEIMHLQKNQGADIGKIVTYANSIEDCQKILDLLIIARNEGFPLISFSMGDIGRFTRIISLFYGSQFSYVSIGKKAAPGQLNIKDFRKIVEVLYS